MDNNFEIINNCYLYSLCRGKLRLFEGGIHLRKDKTITYFMTKDKRNKVSSNEKEVYNDMIWFRDRNDEAAKQLLIAYQHKHIASLNKQIANRLLKINVVERTIFNEEC